jgi:hypothetical protein
MHSDTIFGRRGAVLVISMPGKKVPERYSGLLPPEKKTSGTAFRTVPSQKYPWVYVCVLRFLIKLHTKLLTLREEHRLRVFEKIV